MPFVRMIVIAIVVLVSFWLQPAVRADAGQFLQSQDYTEVTQAIAALTQAQENPKSNLTQEQLQLKLANLQLQKYILETSEAQASCQNLTGKNLAVYLRSKKAPADQPGMLYYLGNNELTDDDFACQGVLLPVGSQIAYSPLEKVQELTSPLALKIVDGTQFVIRSNPETGVIDFNIPPAQTFQSGEGNWSIPTTLSQADIDAQVANAPAD